MCHKVAECCCSPLLAEIAVAVHPAAALESVPERSAMLVAAAGVSDRGAGLLLVSQQLPFLSLPADEPETPRRTMLMLAVYTSYFAWFRPLKLFYQLSAAFNSNLHTTIEAMHIDNKSGCRKMHMYARVHIYLGEGGNKKLRVDTNAPFGMPCVMLWVTQILCLLTTQFLDVIRLTWISTSSSWTLLRNTLFSLERQVVRKYNTTQSTFTRSHRLLTTHSR